MAIARRAITVTSSATGNSIAVNKPTGTVDGDVMIAGFLHATGTTDQSLAAPAGWTVIGSALVNGDLNGKFWYKVAASEGSSYTFTSSTSNDAVVIIASYSGVDNTNPINTSNASAPSATSATLSLSVTTTVANCMLVFISMADTAAAETMTWDASMTEFQDGSYEATFLILGGAEEQVTTATSYTRVATKSGTNRRLSGGLIALAPATASAYTVSKSETVTLSEAVSAQVGTSQVSKSESITLSEATAQLITSFVSKSETVTLSESVAAQVVSTVNKSESVSLSESVAAVVGAPQVSKTESVTISEAVGVALNTTVNKTETITLSESVNVAIVAAGGLSIPAAETITLSESVAAVVGAPQVSNTETVTLSEAVGVALNTTVNKTETITLSEAVGVALNTTVNKTETITLSEALGVVIQSGVSKTETITLGESVSAVVSAPQISQSESITISETVNVSVGVAGNVSVSNTESITISEAVTVTIAALPALEIYQTETITITEVDAAYFSMSVNVSDAISVTDAGLADLFTSYNIHAVELITVQDEAGAQVIDRKSRFFKRYVLPHGRGVVRRA